MYILKNAVTSIARNKGRNLLIGIVILVIACFASVTLAINNSSSSLISSYEDKYEVEATIGINRDNMMKDFNPEDRDNSKENMRDKFNSISSISTDDISEYADSKYVKSYYYTLSLGVNSSLEKAEVNSGDDRGGNRPKDDFLNNDSTDFSLKGYSSIDSMQDFIEGNYTISDGEVSSDFSANNCIINSELATLNGISVGDTITIIDSLNEENTYELTVTGIYKEKEDSDNGMNMFSNSVNTIITNTTVVNNISNNNSELNVSSTPTFILTNKEVVEKFQSELYEKGMDSNLSVETNLDQVENATSTISNVKTFAVTFLIITLIIGTVILFVINMINLRERKYEIGVLRTIGMKKSKVCMQFLCELLIVSFASLIIGCGIGAIVSVPISNSLLSSEISSSESEINNINKNFGREGDFSGKNGDNPGNKPDNKSFKGVAKVEAFDSINAVVDFKVLAELLGIGLLITLISCSSSMISIQKFSPLTILKERS